MLPVGLPTIRLLLVCAISAIIGGAIVYNFMNQPDPELWQEFMEWKKMMGYWLLCLK
ncbi:MAG: hypothetical protein NWF01_06695 [Candidatus Bathyarchaeota archaeon]|nr:hypothetical protein [Candidatus Bathyarchaeota archaeon]